MSEPSVFSIKLRIELISLLLTSALVLLVVYPLLNRFESSVFLYANSLFVFIFLSYSRYLFLLKYSLLSHLQPLKFILVFASIPLIFYQVELIQNFQEFLDNEGFQGFQAYFLPEITPQQQQQVIEYMRREYLFFGVSSVIVAVLLPFRLLISYWRVHNNTGTV